jgi:Ca2+-binding RTX toxin-like protein
MSHLFSGAIDAPGWGQIFEVDLIAGLTYTIEVRGADSGSGTLPDPGLDLGGPGTISVFDEDSGAGRDARLGAHRPQWSGLHTLTVWSEDAGIGSFQVLVSTGFGTAAGDSVTGTEGENHVNGLAGDDRLNGMGGDDLLIGGAGQDFIDGGLGLDLMRGGRGSDFYLVDSTGDVVREAAGSGWDSVEATVDYALPEHVESLRLGGAAVNGIGNRSANLILGNASASNLLGLGGADSLYAGQAGDHLDGGRGSDRMEGGGGDDQYHVDEAGDTVIETAAGAGGGDDTVNARVSYALGENLENLSLAEASGAARGTGNGLANALHGNSAANVLRGGGGGDLIWGHGGGDVLIGGRGPDHFKFTAIADSPPDEPTRIRAGGGAVAFERPGSGAGDLLVFEGVDANAEQPGYQAFRLDGTHRIGRLWLVDVDGDTVVRGNVSARPGAELALVIEDGRRSADDYSLADFRFDPGLLI